MLHPSQRTTCANFTKLPTRAGDIALKNSSTANPCFIPLSGLLARTLPSCRQEPAILLSKQNQKVLGRVRHGGNARVCACNVQRKQTQWKAQDKATGRAAKARKLSA